MRVCCARRHTGIIGCRDGVDDVQHFAVSQEVEGLGIAVEAPVDGAGGDRVANDRIGAEGHHGLEIERAGYGSRAGSVG